MAKPFSRRQELQLQLWQDTICSMRPIIDRILRDYEEACQQVSNAYQKLVHGFLADNLRAKFERQKGTCEGFWYYKAQQQTSDTFLLKKMERTYQFVDTYRAFEVHVGRSQKNCENHRSFRTAGEICKRIITLQSEHPVQAELDSRYINPLAIDLTHFPIQQASTPFLPVKSISAPRSVPKHVCLGQNGVRKTQSRLTSSRALKARSSLNTSMHPPLMFSGSPASSQKRYASYCHGIVSPFQSFP